MHLINASFQWYFDRLLIDSWLQTRGKTRERTSSLILPFLTICRRGNFLHEKVNDLSKIMLWMCDHLGKKPGGPPSLNPDSKSFIPSTNNYWAPSVVSAELEEEMEDLSVYPARWSLRHLWIPGVNRRTSHAVEEQKRFVKWRNDNSCLTRQFLPHLLLSPHFYHSVVIKASKVLWGNLE